jgi:cytochrome bd-type quinol oxidase subunit 2
MAGSRGVRQHPDSGVKTVMITDEVVTNFLQENWLPVLCLVGMVLILVGVLVDQAFKEARWRQDKRRRAMSEWASKEGGVVFPAVVGLTAGAGKCFVCGSPVVWEHVQVCRDKAGNQQGILRKFYCSVHVPTTLPTTL